MKIASSLSFVAIRAIVTEAKNGSRSHYKILNEKKEIMSAYPTQMHRRILKNPLFSYLFVSTL
jgi:hypothetical protein